MSQTISNAPSRDLGYYTREKLPIPQGRTVIDLDGFSNDVILNRQKDQITVDVDGYKNDLRIVTSHGRAFVDRDGIVNDVEIRITPGQIVVDRENVARDLTVQYARNAIVVDRDQYANDYKISFSNSLIEVAQNGHPKVRIQRNGDKIFFDREGTKDDLTIPVGLFPGGWPSKPSLLSVCDYIGMEPTVADALDRWNASGQVDPDDLIRATPKGEVLFLDNKFV